MGELVRGGDAIHHPNGELEEFPVEQDNACLAADPAEPVLVPIRNGVAPALGANKSTRLKIQSLPTETYQRRKYPAADSFASVRK